MVEFIRVAELAREGGPERALRRSAERGDTFRVARGRFIPDLEWKALDPDAQYKAKIRAWVETTHVPQVFSHWSAAALWGYPIIGSWPSQTHVTLGLRSGQRSTLGVVRHLDGLRDGDVVEHDGLLVTSPTRTIADLARVAPFATGVAACDRALREQQTGAGMNLHVERDALLDIAARLAGQRGVCRLRKVAEFGDGRSGSAGESFSRVQIARLHMPPPDLQVEVIDLDGAAWHSDFGWEASSLLGEFDGLAKYTRNRYLKGKSVADIVIEEKIREDAMRLASGCRMVRWTWPVTSDLAQLGRLLVGAGLTPES